MSKEVVVCSSASFYKHVSDIQDQLEAQGFNITIPKSAAAMKATGDFTLRQTWYDNPDDYSLKADFMRSHFDLISRGDVVLVVNDEKHGVKGYIGPNVLMEMSLAWYQHKPIYILYPIPENSLFEEEIKGMSPVYLGGNISNFTELLQTESPANL